MRRNTPHLDPTHDRLQEQQVFVQLTHGNADVGLFQRRRIVHTITSHGAHIALALQRAHNGDLIGGLGTCVDIGVRCDGVELALNRLELHFQLVATQTLSLGDLLLLLLDANAQVLKKSIERGTR